ncbi:MAG TPA: hypothetical protein VGU19_02570 [Microvirga sp.]|jgi:hypothetical protein|nr:hypothetical protein [Microvirga sp.]
MRTVSQTRESVICFIETCSFIEWKGYGAGAWSKNIGHVTPPSAEVDEKAADPSAAKSEYPIFGGFARLKS